MARRWLQLVSKAYGKFQKFVSLCFSLADAMHEPDSRGTNPRIKSGDGHDGAV